MDKSQYGNSILLIAGIQFLLVFIPISGMIISQFNSSWANALLQSPVYWVSLPVGPMMLLRIGFLLRSGDINNSNVSSINTNRLIFESYGGALLSVLALVSSAIIIFLHV